MSGPAPHRPAASDRLDTWGPIADYLKVTPKTAQKYERAGLPVHRLPGSNRVFAYAAEIDRWLDSRAAPQRRWRWALLSAVVIILAAVIVWFFWGRRSPQPVAFIHTDRLLGAVTAEGGAVRSVQVTEGPHRLAVSPDGSRIYVIGARSRAVTVVEAATLRALASIEIPEMPLDVAVTAKEVIVATNGDGLRVIDPVTHRMEAIRDGMADGSIRSIALSPDGKRIYLAMDRAGLRVFDLASRSVKRLTAIGCPWFLAADRAKNRLFVATQCYDKGNGRDAIDVIDLATDLSIAVLKGPPQVAGQIAVSPDGGLVWLHGWDACRSSIYTSSRQPGCPVIPGPISNVYRVEDLSLLRSLPIHGTPLFTPDGTRVVVIGEPVRIFYATSLVEEASWSGNYVAGAFDPRGCSLYLVDGVASRLDCIEIPQSSLAPPQSALMHHWAGDGNLNDRKDGLALQPNGTPEFAPGLIGQAVRLDRGSVEASTENLITLDGFSLKDGSLLAWVKLSRVDSSSVLFDFVFSNSARKWRLGLEAGGRLNFSATGSESFAMDGVLKSNTWHLIALVNESRTRSLWIDGRRLGIWPSVPVGTESYDPTTKRLQIGPSPGLLDEVLVYERALPEAEIGRIFALGRRNNSVFGSVR